jgi:hypothetical protein
MSERVAVLYRIIEDWEGVNAGGRDGGSNCIFVFVAKGREVLLLDLLQTAAMMKLTRNDKYYSFYAVVNGGYQSLPSAACALPILNGITEIILVPSTAPCIVPINQSPEWFLFSTAPDQVLIKFDEPLIRDKPLPKEFSAEKPRIAFSQVRFSGSGQDDTSFSSRASKKYTASVKSGSNVNSSHREHEQSGSSRFVEHFTQGITQSAPSVDDTVAALTGAASVATEATGQAARSLFNFAAKSLQSVVHSVSSLSGHQQVGNHRIVVIKELAQGGFGIVFLVRDAQHPDTLYAMKQMFCQSKEQVTMSIFVC